MTTSDTEQLLRTLAPQVLGTLVRRYGGFDTCEDAVQEALIAAATRWPEDGLPDNPRAWLVTVASRRRIELWRNETARRRREEDVVALTPPDQDPVSGVDDTLTLFLLCCHPALTRTSQVALTLRAIGGLTTTEIARAFLVPESTIGQRISRAKKTIRNTGFHLPPPDERAERLEAVLHVLYLIFNEGYTATSGPTLHRVELTTEAIRLTRQLRTQLPNDGEVAGLLALMLLTDARREARTTPDGALIPLDQQDRTLWNTTQITEGDELITTTLATAPIGPYQIQAAIAAVHDSAAKAEDTDWPQILGLYDLLTTIAPGPMVTLNRLVATAMVHGPTAGLTALETAATDPALAGHHRVTAVRAHLLDMAGDHPAAITQYRLAAAHTDSHPEQRYLLDRATQLTETRDGEDGDPKS